MRMSSKFNIGKNELGHFTISVGEEWDITKAPVPAPVFTINMGHDCSALVALVEENHPSACCYALQANVTLFQGTKFIASATTPRLACAAHKSSSNTHVDVIHVWSDVGSKILRVIESSFSMEDSPISVERGLYET